MQTDLFKQKREFQSTKNSPLAERMRPETLEDFYGQRHLVGEGRMLAKMLHSDILPSLILWGPPGSGKTTLAHIIAKATKSHFIFFSAILSGVKEMREIFKEGEEFMKRGEKTLLFVDEIHRFNKAQQDAFLPFVEKGVVTIIGATTENPSFEVISPLLSRCRVLKLEPIDEEYIKVICKKALSDTEKGLGALNLSIDDDALKLLAQYAAGDARKGLNSLEIAANLSVGRRATITLDELKEAIQSRTLIYDKSGEEHYNVISAFIKSMRASDPDAAIYWAARMLEAGEDPLFILRRMIIFASEDIGNADPRAMQIANTAFNSFQIIGMPEGRIIIGQAVTYLATAPKSNASYLAIDDAIAEVKKSGNLAVPMHLRNAPTKLMKELGYAKGYKYPHNYENGYAGDRCMPDELGSKIFYNPKGYGYEKNIKERMEWLKNKIDKK